MAVDRKHLSIGALVGKPMQNHSGGELSQPRAVLKSLQVAESNKFASSSVFATTDSKRQGVILPPSVDRVVGRVGEQRLVDVEHPRRPRARRAAPLGGGGQGIRGEG